MHAIVRHMVMNDPRAVANPSDPGLRAKFGLPINQEDMVYTLMTFSYVVIEGFRVMGYDMTEAQRDGYVHCWNVVGHLMGIQRRAPARTLRRRGGVVCGHPAPPMRALAGGSEADQGADRRRRGRPAGRAPRPADRRAHRRLVGDATADALEIPRPTPVQKLRLDACSRSVGGVSACRHTVARGPAVPLCLRGAASRHHGQDGRHGRRGVRSPARVRRTLVSRRPGTGGNIFFTAPDSGAPARGGPSPPFFLWCRSIFLSRSIGQPLCAAVERAAVRTARRYLYHGRSRRA